jgi:hypothetical protein
MLDPMDATGGRPSIDDRWARLLLNPLFGILIPNLAGLIDHRQHSTAGLLASYAWFILVAFVTWEGNLRLYFRFQDRSDWLTRPWRRVRLLLGLVCLFTVPFVAQALWGWALVTGDTSATWRTVATAVLVTVSAVIYITHVYETVFLLRDWETERLRVERLQRENIEAELEALKSDVDPHTLFNNLNALSHLVEQGSPRAAAFVQALAAAYRYLLRTRRRRLVTLADELALMDHFQALVALRQADAFQVAVAVPAAEARRWAIPPVSLPELLENAVKHNELTPERPLRVEVRLDGDRLVVSNAIRPRRSGPPSSGLGLRNLSERFRLITGVPARTAVIDGCFVVTLPLVAATPEIAAAGWTGDSPRSGTGLGSVPLFCVKPPPTV